jgi:hypothetical protein
MRREASGVNEEYIWVTDAEPAGTSRMTEVEETGVSGDKRRLIACEVDVAKTGSRGVVRNKTLVGRSNKSIGR